MATAADSNSSHSHLREVVAFFLKLGFIAFGGPAAHIAMMNAEVVEKRHWVTRERFLDLLGAANLIPGPSSTELAIYLGYVRAGWPGLILGGVCFIAPAMALVLAIAVAYARFGSLPQIGWLLYGVKPVIIAIVLQALWNLGRTAVKGPLTAAIGLAVLALALAGVNLVLLLFAAGILVVGVRAADQGGPGPRTAAFVAPLLLASGSGILPSAGATPVTLWGLTAVFLKIGSILFGSGYVLLAFLRADLVQRLGWLTDHQLIDAIAVGQVTPGPVFTTATFIGYLIAGFPGAVLATVGIFLPSFVLVAVTYPIISTLRSSRWAGGFLDGVNVASLALMAAVTWYLGRSAVVDPVTAAVAMLALLLLFRYKVNSAWLVFGGAAVGLVRFFIG
ncbi:MAG TPA: chromate efflux transporter [Candidatus Baltobacteraceae bacterium]|nr:chromate efflux transporter [Candidatus Baltobacteraceae bacterium]